MYELSFPVEVVGGVPVVAAPEEIDIVNAAGLRAALLEAAQYGNGAVVVDMSRTQFCDSSGLNVLVLAHRRAESAHGELRLVVGGPAVLRMFAITGVDRVISSFSSLEDALAQTPAATIDRPQARLSGEFRIGTPADATAL